MEFNGNLPRVIHLDINSCFATIEQQANPILRDKPLVVAAYATNSGCILAASVTAKKIGIKTGMRVADAKKIYPRLTVLTPDPAKYRFIHKKIFKILKNYSNNVIPKSIDEFTLKLQNSKNPKIQAIEIKKRIKREIGEYITVSIGISTNRYLAKIASNLQKPDGLSEINKDNVKDIFSKLKLTDLTGVKSGNSRRLNLYGIRTLNDFYEAPVWKLKLAFGGIGGLYWHTWLHGYETNPSWKIKTRQETYGNSYAPPLNKAHLKFEILSKLCEKTGFRLRKAGLIAQGVHLAISFRDGFFWHKGIKTKETFFESKDIYAKAVKLLNECPDCGLLRILAVNVFSLQTAKHLQLDIFKDQVKKNNLVTALDNINNKWGLFTIYPARMSRDTTVVQDRISFGQV